MTANLKIRKYQSNVTQKMISKIGNLWSQPWNRIYKDTVKFLNLFLVVKKKSLSGTIQNQIIFIPGILITKSDLVVQK